VTAVTKVCKKNIIISNPVPIFYKTNKFLLKLYKNEKTENISGNIGQKTGNEAKEHKNTTQGTKTKNTKIQHRERRQRTQKYNTGNEDKEHKNTTQETKMTSNTSPTKNPGTHAPNRASRDILLSLQIVRYNT
jgi:hypothetical protein